MIYYPPLKILNATAFYSPLDFLAYAAHIYCCPLWARWKERKPRPLLVKSRRGQSFSNPGRESETGRYSNRRL